MCANALNIHLNLVNINLLSKQLFQEEYLKKNPQHTVPFLEEDDGFVLTDSHAIMAYLVAKYGAEEDSLYPKNDHRLRAIIDSRLHYDSSALFIRGLNISKPMYFYNIKPTQDKIDELKESFEVLDRILKETGTKYIAGNNLTIADFSIVTSLTSWNVYVNYENFPNLKIYVERVQKLPCYEENRKGLEDYVNIIQETLARVGSDVEAPLPQ
ncbi:hypothetical protein ABEB36_000998 [Hypothenemus hampei]|uniref:Glutathione S-transferase 1-like n=1 Tax=Hypothenemus hampei TaxID=57062 RepID=A0ABD1FD45_HYPHA